MSLKEKIVKSLFGDLIQAEVQKSSKQVISYIGTSTAANEGVSPDIDFEIFNQMFEQTSWVRAVVGVICKAVTARGYSLSPSKTNADQRNAETLQSFFANCNPNDTLLEILDDIARDIYVFGNAFLEVVYGADGKPRELWNLDPTSMRVIADEHGEIAGYVQMPRSQSGKVTFEPREVIHLKLGSKGATLYGLSPLASLVLPITVDKYSQIYNRAFFLNGAKVRGAFIMKDASPEQVERNRDYMAERVKNPDMAHSDLVLEGDIEFKQISVAQKDMEFLELREFTRNEILAVYGVPPSKVSIIETGNIGAGSGDHQTQTFYEETILPFQMRVADKLTKHIIRQGFGIQDWSFQFNKRAIDEKEQAEIFNIYLQNGVFTPDEVRRIIAPRMPEMQKSLNPRETIANATRVIVALENKFVDAIKGIFREIGNAVKDRLPGLKRESDLEVMLQLVDKDGIAKTIERFSLEAARKGLSISAQRAGLDGVENLSPEAVDKIRSASSALAEDLAMGMADRLRQELSAGIRDNETIPQLIQRIESWVGSQTVTINPILDAEGNVIRQASSRVIGKDILAEVIARTEANRAYNAGNLDALNQAGVEKVQWLLASDACKECADLAETAPGEKLGKVLPLGEAIDTLPAHPNCRCTWVTVLEEK
ncbi:MAG: phage portal protein [Elusimicrobia bacterium RIFOXYA2_FULL_53_38]|nr:MAG: phage portal protein [Elusimicrobia bacterium RIFOXYA2_FULL_53_38]